MEPPHQSSVEYEKADYMMGITSVESDAEIPLTSEKVVHPSAKVPGQGILSYF